MSKEFQIRDGNLIASFDLENEDGDIDFCKLLKVSHGVAEEIGMFVDYVATNKIIKDQSKQISDLEAKLAELREQITICDEENSKTFMKSVNAWRENAELKQQLAEKEKIIEAQHNGIGYWKSVAEKRPDFDCIVKIKELEQQLAEKEEELKAKETLNQIFKDNRETKISFALEQLEKVKEIVRDNSKATGFVFAEQTIDVEDFEKIIDNQIKQLKEMK